MKVLLCLNRDIHCILAFNYLLPYIKNHQVNICFSTGVGIVPNNKDLKKLRDCECDVSINNIQFIAAKSGIKINSKAFLSFEQIEQNFRIFNFNDINTDGLEYLSQNWQPNLIISIRFGQIFKSQIIALPKFGIINLHSGILPNYRGILATFWSMLNGEKEIGTTLHFVNDAKIDTGDIIAIAKNKVDCRQSLIVNIFRLYPEGVRLIASVIDKVDNHSPIETIEQDKSLGKYFSYPADKNIKDFFGKELSFL